jgi:YgiT-type zinc finger domain-containing protein
MPETTRECPLCGGTMHLKRLEHVMQIPGHRESAKRTTAEWVCPDCDNFEEAEEERT